MAARGAGTLESVIGVAVEGWLVYSSKLKIFLLQLVCVLQVTESRFPLKFVIEIMNSKSRISKSENLRGVLASLIFQNLRLLSSYGTLSSHIR